MTKFSPLATLSFLAFVFFFPTSANAQDIPPTPPYQATPAHMWELGFHGGTAVNFGDIEFVPNWGTGFHIRRAIDYVFSIRGEALYAKLKQEDNVNGSSESTIQSGSLQLVVSINNLVWNNVPRRKTNLYGFVGGGVTYFEVDALEILTQDLNSINPTTQTHADLGLGIAFRLSERFNLGFESKAQVLFGKHADLLDGIARQQGDVLGYGNVRLNFNLGNKEKKAEPLYWVNPMDIIMQDITELKKRPVFDMTDSDADGVIDLLDQDNTTPPGTVVDTRGIPLDSDNDGIPNNQDDEPYLPESSKIVTRKEGDRPVTNEDDVRKIMGDEMNKIVNQGQRGTNGDGNGKDKNSGSSSKGVVFGSGITDWFLPNVHFNIDSYKVRYAEYGSLSSIAKVMKSNPSLAIVVTGFTDKTASDSYNLDLSYQRAKAAIEHLVSIHGIARSRLILNYNGEDFPLVPSTGSTIMNRRVEFRVASDEDEDMEQPTPVTKKNGNSKGGF
ncbi:MAG: OmpA family protein [Bacteroidetes bacterium]|nr:OmpA family protein [Bacteroidota bacterium]